MTSAKDNLNALLKEILTPEYVKHKMEKFNMDYFIDGEDGLSRFFKEHLFEETVLNQIIKLDNFERVLQIICGELEIKVRLLMRQYTVFILNNFSKHRYNFDTQLTVENTQHKLGNILKNTCESIENFKEDFTRLGIISVEFSQILGHNLLD